jgi:site-specific recombinase XerC
MRTYRVVVGFVRMAFREYWMRHEGWHNPFERLKPPKQTKKFSRDAISEDEVMRLLAPSVITDPLERAVFICF